jgi:membrane-bound serine protease (ClpP class)
MERVFIIFNSLLLFFYKYINLVFTFLKMYDIIKINQGGNMWEEIVLMFNTMQWYIYVPGFGVFGISGFASIIGAIVAQGVLYQSIAQVLFLISITILAVLLIFLIFLRSARFGIIGKSPFVQNKTAVPVDYDSKNKNELKWLIGQRGVVITPLRPSGKFMVDDKVFEGITAGEPIDKDEIIKVVDVEGTKIKVEKVEV